MDQNRTVLRGPRVALRPPKAGDGGARRALGVHAEIVAGFGGDPEFLTELTEERARAWEDRLRADPQAWIIEVGVRLIGSARLHSINRIDQRAMVDIGILDPAALGRGFGTEALRLLCVHAFGALELHRLSLRVLAGNARAIAAYRKVGFVEEGREQESARVGESWQDDIRMGLLAHEFEGTP